MEGIIYGRIKFASELGAQQNLALCHVRLSIVVKDDFPMCNPLILWNLYSLSRINFLDREVKALTA